jgi:type III secretory pathway component EscV
MAETLENTSLGQYIFHRLSEGHRREQIEADLIEKGHEERFIRDLIQETAKLRYAKLRSQGLALILSGAFICFLSFLLTITSSFTQSNFHMILYGLTSVGILVIFAGFVKIF